MTNIDNDAYLIIVYKDFDSIIVSEYKEKDKEDTANGLNTAANNTKTDTGSKWLKLLTAGVTSSIAQNAMSKLDISPALRGRIQSSLYDIIADGKISNQEVAEDFIGSCTNELDTVALKAGYPSVSAIYEAISPNGAGVISQDFMKQFQKASEVQEGEKLAERNKVAQDLTVLKFKLVTGDNESWASELPSRKTEKGFDIVEAIQNSNITKDFDVSIVQSPYNGVESFYDYKKELEGIRDRKIPFDVYVNDPDNRKQLAWKHCFFTGINFNPEGINALNASMSITQIPEYEVRVEQVSGGKSDNKGSRKQGKASSSKGKNNKTAKAVKDSGAKANAGTTEIVPWVKNNIAKERSGVNSGRILTLSNGKLNRPVVYEYLHANGCKGTIEAYGIK